MKAQMSLTMCREGRTFVAYEPALDLAAQGNTASKARKNFQEVFAIYLEETIKKGTLEKDLLRCGWNN